MTKNTFIKFADAVQTVIQEGRIPESAKLRFVESLAKQVKGKKRIVKEAASESALDARDAIEHLMVATFGSMRGDDPQDIFFDYTPSTYKYEITVMALGDKEKAQQQKHVTNFAKRAKLVDGVRGVNVGEWDGDGDENRPYGLDIVVKFAEPA